MDSIKSFKGYGKVDEVEQQAFRRKTRRRIITIVAASVVLLAIIIAAVTITLVRKRDGSSSSSANSSPASEVTPAAKLSSLCSLTEYPTSCKSSLEGFNTTDPEVLFRFSLRVAIDELAKLKTLPDELAAKTTNEAEKKALVVCGDMIDDAADRLNDTAAAMESSGEKKLLSPAMIADFETWLSAALTDQETCLDGLAELNSTLLPEVTARMQNSTELASNSLSFAVKALKLLANLNIPSHRRLLAVDDEGFPGWLSAGDRRLLQDDKNRNSTPAENTITVAKDGTGDFMTISQAVARVPSKSKTRFVIRIKQGRYVENVNLDKNKWNIMMLGDGKTKTIISGSLNFVDGTPTFSTATFAVVGKGFIAKDIKFVNTAGPQKHQAVAMRSGSDMSVFFRCSFDAFQDTLYAHSNRQFYRDCDITGTIDFIFGNAASVFQGCTIQPRQPLPNQFNTITAQGKKDRNQNTGISIHRCAFAPKDANLTAATYLGRPWKEFSTTVIMQSSIGAFLHRSGWREWVTGVKPPSTIFYGEYRNTGPGSSLQGRVNWAGYKPVMSDNEARRYSVGTFIQGAEWLAQSGVVFQSTL